MCSQNEAEVEVVKNELFKAGITSETRTNPIAKALGIRGVELWVQEERDFFEASKLYAKLQDRAGRRLEKLTSEPQIGAAEVHAGAKEPVAEEPPPADGEANGADPGPASVPRRAELRQASSVLGRGIEEMIQRERELTEECGSLRSKVEELSQALAREQAARARETESRMLAEKNQAGQVAGLLSALERERQEWEQRSKSRDDLLQQTQGELEGMSRLLQDQQSAAATLTEAVASLEEQRNEYEKSLADARREAAAEQEARLAAEERAEQAGLAQGSLQKQLVQHQELEQKMQAYVASLSALCGKTL